MQSESFVADTAGVSTQKRNDISNQRIRNSEIIVHLAQKQILAAHTEYKEQVLSGNKKAIFDISQTKVLSDFINSEIIGKATKSDFGVIFKHNF